VVGEVLSSVTFVMDYLQVDFSGHRLTCLVWPLVRSGEQHLWEKDDGYRDMLCSLIGGRVVEVDEYLDLGLLIVFEGDRRISFPLRVEEGYTPEILIYDGPMQEWVWTVDDEPFASFEG
jgi:hypothetical protein